MVAGSVDLQEAKNKKLTYRVPEQPVSGAKVSGAKAVWVFNLQEAYRPGAGVEKNRVLVAFEFDAEGKDAILNPANWIYSEADNFEGEANPAHWYQVIVKRNEIGAYGLGANFKAHVQVLNARLANKAEFADALGLNELEIKEKYKRQKW